MKEKYILTGKLEETNDSYSIAKITGIKMCESYNQQYKTNYKSLITSYKILFLQCYFRYPNNCKIKKRYYHFQ